MRIAWPWAQRLLLERQVRRHMAAIETAVHAQGGAAIGAAALHEVDGEFAALARDASSLQTLRSPGRRALNPIGLATIVSAAELKDPRGGAFTVLVSLYTNSIVATVWPTGATDPIAVVQSCVYQFNAWPATPTTAGPPCAPASAGRTLPVDIRVDGQTVPGWMGLLIGGRAIGDAEGWHEPNAPMPVIEPGRFGCHNVDVTLAPAKTLPHAPADAIQFRSDGRLLLATPDRVETLDVDNASHTVVDTGHKPDAFVAHWSFSRDGTQSFDPWHGGASARIDTASGKLLSSSPRRATFAGSQQPGPFGFDEGYGVYGFGPGVFAHTDATGRRTEMAVRAGTTVTIEPDPTPQDRTALNGCREYAVGGGRLAIGFLNRGLYVFDPAPTGWTPGRRVDDWDGEGLALSPDGRWLAAVGGRTATVYDAATLRGVFRAPIDGADTRVAAASWDDRGDRAALLANGSPVLVLPKGFGGPAGGTAVAIRFAAVHNTMGIPVPRCVALSPDGRRVAMLDGRSKQLMLWDADALVAAAQAAPATPAGPVKAP